MQRVVNDRGRVSLQVQQVVGALAAWVDLVPSDLLVACRELFEHHPQAERHSDMMREIALNAACRRAEEVVRAFINTETCAWPD